jgi:hypothetical protein
MEVNQRGSGSQLAVLLRRMTANRPECVQAGSALPCPASWWRTSGIQLRVGDHQLCHGCHLGLSPRPDGYSRNAVENGHA